MAVHKVRCLLMGGQACVFYGAAEFSRDSDFAILANVENLARLQAALRELQAEVIAVPPFEITYLERGHAVHFRCRHPDCTGLRVDVMSVMRGVDSFELLWDRRASIQLRDGTVCDLLSVADLVKAKKTQRDKDWPMIRRLLEADYFGNQEPSLHAERLTFWFRELRTPELLIAICAAYPKQSVEAQRLRPLIGLARAGRLEALDEALRLEEFEERRRDREYWAPLKKELEALRHRA